MKIISWNVNGIRACAKKGFFDFLKSESPDIICLQEVRAEQSQITLNEADEYEIYWNSAEKKGYSGTAIFSKQKALNVRYGIGIKEHDKEGRVITAEYKDFYLITVYTPNSKRGLLRLEYRTQEWDVEFLKYANKLNKKKPVIFCGDLNVAHKEIDLANPKANKKNAGFTDEERASFDNIIDAGYLDTFREFCNEGGHYSWWSNFAKSRERNIGWRIDYFCIAKELRENLHSASILPEIKGSDHCPITIDIF